MKSFLLLPLLFMVLLSSSCTKEQVVQPNRTILATLRQADWKYDANSKTYYNQIAMPEINNNVNLADGVLVYITYDNAIYEALPNVLDGVTFIYRYQPGSLTVEMQGAGGAVVNPPGSDIGIKIVLIPSQVE